MTICDILRKGSANALTSQAIQTATGLTDEEVRHAIRRERLQGVPICSCGSGFFLPESKMELLGTIRSFQNREKEIERTRHALEDSLERIYG